MRFTEFKVLKEATGTLNAISQVANLANTILDPFGSMGGDTGKTADTADTSGIKVPGSNIGSGGKGSVSKDSVSSYLKSKMDDNHRLGILVNIQGESGFSPGIIGDNNTSGGLFQHHNDRFTNMVNAVGSDWATDWEGQIDFALSEPKGREYISTRFSSPEAAAKWWTINFEVPANKYAKAEERSRMLKNFA